MIGTISIECNAKNPNMPLHPLRAYINSPSSLRITNVPRKIGKWNINKVTIVAIYPDSTSQTAECVLTGGVWVGTIEGSTTAGTLTQGYSIIADGVDENGNDVTGYVLGKGDVEIMQSNSTPEPKPSTTFVRLQDDGTGAKDGVMYPTESGYVIQQNGEAHQLGTPFEQITAYVDSQVSSKAEISSVPTKTSDLSNDSGFITEASYIEDANENRINADRSVSYIGDGTPCWQMVSKFQTIPKTINLEGTKTDSSYIPTGDLTDGDVKVHLTYTMDEWQLEIQTWDAGLQEWSASQFFSDTQSGESATELNFDTPYIGSCVWTTPKVVINDNLVTESSLSSIIANLEARIAALENQ